MANLSDSKLLSGRSAVIGYSYVKAEGSGDKLSVNFPPKAFEGSWTYQDGEMFYSNGQEWKTPALPPIVTPTPLIATNSSQQRQLRLSGFLASAGYTSITQKKLIFEISFNSLMVDSRVISIDSTNRNNYILGLDEQINGIPLVVGTVFYWRGKYGGGSGSASDQESVYSRVERQVFPELIDKPVPINTLAGSTTNEIEVSLFTTGFNEVTDSSRFITYSSTEFRAYRANPLDGSVNLSSPLFSATDIEGDNKFNTLLGSTDRGIIYYWQARYLGTDSEYVNIPAYASPWSELQKQVQILEIATPRIINAGTTSKISKIQLSDYSSSNESTLELVEWQLYTTSNIRTTNADGSFVVVDNINLATGVQEIRTATYLYTKLLIALANRPLTADQNYFWRARFKSNIGTYSEFTTITPAVFRIPFDIESPQITNANNTEIAELSITAYDSFENEFAYESTIWKIYSSANIFDSNGNSLQPLVEITNVDTRTKQLSGNLIGNPALQNGNSYYWIARYSGIGGINYTTGAIDNRISYSKWTPVGRFVQASTIVTPVITGKYLNGQDYDSRTGNVPGPTLQFESSIFTRTVRTIIENFAQAIWTVEPIDSRTGQDTFTEIKTNIDNYYTFSSNQFEEDTTYKITVKYTGTTGGTSDESAEFIVTTQQMYRNVVTDPKDVLGYRSTTEDLSPTKPKLVPGAEYMGGYYAGEIWNQIAETSDTTTTTTGTTTTATSSFRLYDMNFTVDSNLTLIANPQDYLEAVMYEDNEANHWRTFKLVYCDKSNPTNINYSAPYQQDIVGNELFYIGQIVQIRSKINPEVWIEGAVVKAFGQDLTIAMYKTSNSVQLGLATLSGLPPASVLRTYTGGFWVMAKYRIMLAPASDFTLTTESIFKYNTAYAFFPPIGDTSGRAPIKLDSDFNFPIPYECFTLSEGWKSTNALYNYGGLNPLGAPYSQKLAPAAYWARRKTLTVTIEGTQVTYNDWYIPSRDEMHLCYFYLNNYVGTTTTNYFTDKTPSWTRYLYSDVYKYTSTSANWPRVNLIYNTLGQFPDKDTDFTGTNRNAVYQLNEYNLIQEDTNTAREFYNTYVINKNMPEKTNPAFNNIIPPSQRIVGASSGTGYYHYTSTISIASVSTGSNIPNNRKAYDQNPIYPYSSGIIVSSATIRTSTVGSTPGYENTAYTSNAAYIRLVRRQLA